MRTFLKIIILVLLGLVAIKLAPLALLIAVGLVIGVLAVIAALAGSATLAGLLLLALLAGLAPVWVPVALVIGGVWLLVRLVRRLA